MIVLNILEENLPFLVIGLMIIVIVVLAYYTFIKPKPKNNVNQPKETKTHQVIINQDSDNLDQTSKATSMEETPEENLEKNQELNELDTSQSVIVQKNNEEEDANSDNNEEDTISEDNEGVSTSKENDETKGSDEETEKTELGKYHIVYRQKDNKWIVNREGSDKTIRVLHTKKEAIAYATIKAINQDTNIVIHGRDGKIEKHGY